MSGRKLNLGEEQRKTTVTLKASLGRATERHRQYREALVLAFSPPREPAALLDAEAGLRAPLQREDGPELIRAGGAGVQRKDALHPGGDVEAAWRRVGLSIGAGREVGARSGRPVGPEAARRGLRGRPGEAREAPGVGPGDAGQDVLAVCITVYVIL